ncbi:hypothetical protein TrVE_jg13486 [Triparma verrucosa]|uniref:HD domain-containing protein n=1 Tax=Triparma verrucosa TaxID=1606542 RepID=A0A9W7BG46_9STRA|nr:hypothetical protein TrVE_jg13486 [Triparma verrucosa]
MFTFLPPKRAARVQSDWESHGFSTTSLKSQSTSLTTRTNDDVHLSISLDPLTQAFLDTPQMQRLRGLSQLGVASYVYINATHTRFEHSLGVAHLAEKLLSSISLKQPQLKITQKDIILTKLAGLTHDLGHGPFSHIYDGELRKQLEFRRKRKGLEDSGLGPNMEEFQEKYKGWAHEDASLDMLDALLAHHGLKAHSDPEKYDEPLVQIGDGIDRLKFGVIDLNGDITPENLITTRDIIYVKECINGAPLNDGKEWIGRKDKEYLYDVISNRHSGLDVDKMDYYARDQKRTLSVGQVEFILIEESFVARGRCSRPGKCFECKNCAPKDVKDHYMICWPEKLVVKGLEFFKTRFSMHSNVYTHKTVKAVEYMICDALVLADPWIPVPNAKGGPPLRISQAMSCTDNYVNLKDSVLDLIESSSDPKLQRSRDIIRKIRSRQFYKCVFSLAVGNKDHEQELWKKSEAEIRKMIVMTSKKVYEAQYGQFGTPEKKETDSLGLKEGDMIVEKRTIHHGQKSENPVNNMRFVSKTDLMSLSKPLESLPVARKKDETEYEAHVPKKFEEKCIRVYCKEKGKESIVLSAAREVITFGSKEKGQVHSPHPKSRGGGKRKERVSLSQNSQKSLAFETDDTADSSVNSTDGNENQEFMLSQESNDSFSVSESPSAASTRVRDEESTPEAQIRPTKRLNLG